MLPGTPTTRPTRHCHAEHARTHARAAAYATPFLPCVSCDLGAILSRVRRERVPNPSGQIPVLFVVQDPLACILHGEDTAEILLHRLLNTPETPAAVFLHILTHEMLHLVIPPRVIDGKETSHPPEFFERERALAPERQQSMSWIWRNFGGFLKRDKRQEAYTLKCGWQRIMFERRVPMEACIKTRDRVLM